jgi:hypothetical protein
MDKKLRLTFKRQPKSTGLSAIGYPNPPVDIKLSGKVCGAIYPPTWQSKIGDWKISLMVKKDESDPKENCDWKWITLKYKGENEEDCKKFLIDKMDIIVGKYTLHYVED